MRIEPTTQHKLKKKEETQKKIDFYMHKVAIGFVLFILVFLFLKMLLPSSV